MLVTANGKRSSNAAGRLVMALAWTLLLAGEAGAQVPPERAEALEAAQQQYRAENYAAAADRLEALVEDAPALAEAHRLLGHVYVEMDRPAEARQAFARAIAHGRITAAMLDRLANLDQAAGRPDAALAASQWRLLLEPGESTWRLWRAQLLLENGAAAEAANLARQTTAANPATRAGWLVLGNARLAQERLAEAVAAFATGYHLGQRDAALARTVAGLCERLDRPQQAAAWLERAISQTQGEARRALVLRRARLVIAAELTELPITRLKTIAETDSTSAGEAAALLGQRAQQHGNEAAALDWWRRAGELGEVRPTVLARLGVHHYNAKHHERAADYLKRRLETGNEDAELRRLLVQSLLESGQKAAAREALADYIARQGLDEIARAMVKKLRNVEDGLSGT